VKLVNDSNRPARARTSYNPAASGHTEGTAATLSRHSHRLAQLARAAAGFLLPSRCLACGSHDVDELCRGGVCRDCWAEIPAHDGPRCAVCGETLPAAVSADAETCGRCLLDPPAFARLLSAAPYRGTARAMLLAFKFRGADYLGPRLAEEMLRRLPPPEDCASVAAVPATDRARRTRGYHPAEVLAAAVAERLALPFRRGLLRKTRDTLVQSRVPAAGRAANVRGAFQADLHRAFRGGEKPAGGVLLIDDVATSGATARECARRLAAAGASPVTVWCFARASRLDIHPRIDSLEGAA
jgi:predicted amidophosphoribosyltransferase